MIVFINAAKWHAKNKIGNAREPVILFHEKNLWSKYLSKYAIKLNITPIEYRSVINSSFSYYVAPVIFYVLSKVKSKLKNIKIKNKDTNSKREKSSPTLDRKTPLIAAWYTGKTVTFDLKKRSDFFWLLKSGIPREQVLIYFDRKDIPATEETVNILNREGN